MSTVMKLFGVRDSKSEVYGPPFMARTLGEGERLFKKLVNTPETGPSQFPKDYDLWELGDFEEGTGKIIPCVPRHMINADQLVDRAPLDRVQGLQ